MSEELEPTAAPDERDGANTGGGTATASVPPPPQASPAFPPPTAASASSTAPMLQVRSTQPAARVREVALVLAAAFFANLALRTTVATVAATLAFVLLAAALVSAGRALQRDAKVLLVLAVALAPWLAIRANLALTAVTFFSILLLMALAAGMSIHGSLFDSKVRDFARHIGALSYEWVHGLAMVTRLVKGGTANARGASLVRGALVAAPVLLVFGLLLASADEVFAKFLLIGNLPSVFGHIVTTLAVAIGFLAYLSRRAHETDVEPDKKSIRLLGPIEINLILGSLVVLFAAFVGTQVLVALGGADQILETEGLTQADHARQGFFQLVWVAALSVSLVGALRALRLTSDDMAERASEGSARVMADRFVPLGLATLVLTFAIALVSIQRLLLYIGSFGLSPLRLWALIGAGAIGFMVCIYAVSISGRSSQQGWFPGVAVLSGFFLVFGLNVLNPDVVVANYNIERSNTEAVELDRVLLSTLSHDATTTIVEQLDDINDDASILTRRLCDERDRTTSFGILEYNRASIASDSALDELCGTRRLPNQSD